MLIRSNHEGPQFYEFLDMQGPLSAQFRDINPMLCCRYLLTLPVTALFSAASKLTVLAFSWGRLGSPHAWFQLSEISMLCSVAYESLFYPGRSRPTCHKPVLATKVGN